MAEDLAVHKLNLQTRFGVLLARQPEDREMVQYIFSVLMREKLLYIHPGDGEIVLLRRQEKTAPGVHSGMQEGLVPAKLLPYLNRLARWGRLIAEVGALLVLVRRDLD